MVPVPPSIYPLSLHDALPILEPPPTLMACAGVEPSDVKYFYQDHEGSVTHVRNNAGTFIETYRYDALDRKSTRLNSSHVSISYAVFCLKKKRTKNVYKHYIIV